MPLLMFRWIVAPLSLAVAGLTMSSVSLGIVTRFDNGDATRSWVVLTPIALLVMALVFRVTTQLLHQERSTQLGIGTHFRHMWITYPLWLLFLTGGFGGSHVSTLFLYPFAAFTGIIPGNIASIIRMRTISNN